MADDCEDDRVLTRYAFEAQHPADILRFVEDGEALLATLKAGARPDLVLLDLHMPRMDGRQALAAIRSDDDLRHIKVVLLTGDLNDVSEYGDLLDGADGILPKPIDPTQVAALAMRLLAD